MARPAGSNKGSQSLEFVSIWGCVDFSIAARTATSVCIRRMEQSTAETIADGHHSPNSIPAAFPSSGFSQPFPLLDDCGRVIRVCDVALWAASGILLLGLLLLPVWATLMAALAWQLQRWPAVSYLFAQTESTKPASRSAQGVDWRTITNVRAPGSSTPTRHKVRSNAASASPRLSSTPPGRRIRRGMCQALLSMWRGAFGRTCCPTTRAMPSNIACILRPSSSRSRKASKRLRYLPSGPAHKR